MIRRSEHLSSPEECLQGCGCLDYWQVLISTIYSLINHEDTKNEGYGMHLQ